VDPFIDNLSQLEARIRRIETDLESQRALVRSVCAADGTADIKSTSNLTSRMIKTEKDLQESRSIVAQLRLRGEQRAARGRRAAAAAAAASVASSTPGPDKNTTGKHPNKQDAGQSTAKRANHAKSRITSNKKEKLSNTMESSPIHNSTSMNAMTDYTTGPFYFNGANTSDFINPSPSYYFPSYSSSSTSAYTTDMMCPTASSSSAPSFPTSSFPDWPLLSDLPNTPAPNHSSAATAAETVNGFVDPMIIAAASEANQQYAPPLLSVSSYMVDEENSIMAARARSLSHLPPSTDTNMLIPGLQPSSSSTSTSSNSSFGFGHHHLYEGYTQFMDSNDMMMIDAAAAAAAAAATAASVSVSASSADQQSLR
jgi:hypothetical protein